MGKCFSAVMITIHARCSYSYIHGTDAAAASYNSLVCGCCPGNASLMRWHISASSAAPILVLCAWLWLQRAMTQNTSACSARE